MFFFSSRRRHTRWPRDWSSDVCSSDLCGAPLLGVEDVAAVDDGGPVGQVDDGGGVQVAELAPLGEEQRSEERRVGKEGKHREPARKKAQAARKGDVDLQGGMT